MSDLFEQNTLKVDYLRIDSIVTDSNIAKPSDSQLLNDGAHMLSRLMSQSKDKTGVKIRFTDQRKKSMGRINCLTTKPLCRYAATPNPLATLRPLQGRRDADSLPPSARQVREATEALVQSYS